MARNTVDITITAENRDKGKSFRITELSSDAGEWWANRAVLALAKAGVDLPEGAMGGMAAFAGAVAMSEQDKESAIQSFAVMALGALSGLDPISAKPLLDEMMACVSYMHDMGTGKPMPVPLYTGDACQIEEISTRYKLRRAWIELHTGFSMGAAGSSSAPAAKLSAA